MARIGEPYLVALTSNQMWLFRKAGATFVQLGTLPVGRHNAHTRPVFPKALGPDVNYLYYASSDPGSPAAFFRRVGYSTLGFGAPANLRALAGTEPGRLGISFAIADAFRNIAPLSEGTKAFRANMETYLANPSGGGMPANTASNMAILANGQVAAQENRNPIRYLDQAFSEDGYRFAYILGSGCVLADFNYDTISSVNDIGTTLVNYATEFPGGDFLRPTFRGEYFYILDKGGVKRVIVTDLTTLEKVATDLPHAPSSVAAYGPYVAVGMTYDDGGLTKHLTRIFKQSGTTLIYVSDHAGIGGDVLFFEDGSTLVDPVSKQALTRTGETFTPNSTLLANLPAAVEMGAISDHRPWVPSVAKGYGGAAIDMLTEGVDLAELKVALALGLDSFVSDSESMSEALEGGGEVFGYGWPEGGVPIEGARLERRSGSQLIVTADGTITPVAGGDLTFDSAIVYSGTRPLIRIDFPEEVFIENGSEVLVEFGEDGLVIATA